MSFYKLSLEFYYKKISTIVYLMENLNLKVDFLNYIFRQINNLIRKNLNSKYIKKLGHQNPSQNPPWYQCYHIILPLSPLFTKKTLYEGAWSPYSLIMDYYKFLGTPLKVHYVMAI